MSQFIKIGNGDNYILVPITKKLTKEQREILSKRLNQVQQEVPK